MLHYDAKSSQFIIIHEHSVVHVHVKKLQSCTLLQVYQRINISPKHGRECMKNLVDTSNLTQIKQSVSILQIKPIVICNPDFQNLLWNKNSRRRGGARKADAIQPVPILQANSINCTRHQCNKFSKQSEFEAW